MGLDMYLQAETYVSGYEHSNNKSAYKSVLDALGLNESDAAKSSPSANIAITVAYWRKANAIHKWFVDNVQDGKDECQRSYVSREQLQELLVTAKQALNERGQNSEVLPPQSGFYYANMELTVSQLQAVLNNPRLKNSEFYYRASW